MLHLKNISTDWDNNIRIDIENRIKQLLNRDDLIMKLRRKYCYFTSTAGFKRGLKALSETRKELRERNAQLRSFDKPVKLDFNLDKQLK